MSGQPAIPNLRLVGEPSSAEERVASENRAASRLAPTDARWVLAIRVGQAIEGGRQALLTPEKRRRLMREGQMLGLRDFDSSLIIAIVQDSARTGEGIGYNTEQRLGLIRAPERGRDGRGVLLLAAMSLAIAVLWLVAMVRWLGG